MVGGGKTKEAPSNVLEEDRISELPDPLICQILFHLSTKDAVRTSVLSTRWRSLWLWVPFLELSSSEFPDVNAFVSFGDRFFDSSRVSCIEILNLDIDENARSVDDDVSYLTSWVDAAIMRKVKHLDVCVPSTERYYEMPLSLYICETLVSLDLYQVVLREAGSVSLPCLKTMRLLDNWYPNETTFENLVSSCPVLEELYISVARHDEKFFRVHSRSLKKLTFIRGLLSIFQGDSVSGVVIDAPLLRCMSIYDNVSKSIILNNLESNASLDISFDFGLTDYDEASISSWRSRFRSFLPGILRVKGLELDAIAFKRIHDYSISEPLPQFFYMFSMWVTFCVSDLKCLPTFLQSCPNLKSLSLALEDSEEMCFEKIQISFTSVPECLLSSLKLVDFDIPISGYAAGMKLAKYFLENPENLKKLTLIVSSSWDSSKYSVDYNIFKELLKIPRRSATCEFVLVI